MQILSPSRRSWRQIGGTACEEAYAWAKGLRARDRGQHPARAVGTVANGGGGASSVRLAFLLRPGVVGLPRLAAAHCDTPTPVHWRSGHARPRRLLVLCGCGFERVASVRGFE